MKLKLNYIVIPLIIFFLQALGGYFTNLGMAWYNTLAKSSLTPPNYVFSIVWTIISVLTAVSVILFWNNSNLKIKEDRAILSLFIFNGFLNVFWSYLFFTKRLIFLSLVDSILLLLTLVFLVVLLFRKNKIASLLLLPYLIWLSFAIILNFQYL